VTPPAITAPLATTCGTSIGAYAIKPELKKALKEIIETGRCSDEMALFRLLKAGLVQGSGNVYACRCDLYKLYFKDKLL
jgi:hypothetical protein